MAVSTLTRSELERRRLRATKAQLDQRWSTVGHLLTTSLDQAGRSIAVEAEYQAAGVWTGLRGAEVERIERNRGTSSVAPLVELPGNIRAWFSYQEVWDLENGRSPFAFRQASLTLHLGEVGDPKKPQLLRLEWPGLRDWDRSGVGFQSAGAGHPHWQVDLFESLRDQRDRMEFEADGSDSVENFDEFPTSPSLSDRIVNLTFERMHLASGAQWWSNREPEFGLHHLHAPADQAELSRWLSAAIVYIRQELSRCVARR